MKKFAAKVNPGWHSAAVSANDLTGVWEVVADSDPATKGYDDTALIALD